MFIFMAGVLGAFVYVLMWELFLAVVRDSDKGRMG
jgi:hypothetical protein